MFVGAGRCRYLLGRSFAKVARVGICGAGRAGLAGVCLGGALLVGTNFRTAHLRAERKGSLAALHPTRQAARGPRVAPLPQSSALRGVARAGLVELLGQGFVGAVLAGRCSSEQLRLPDPALCAPDSSHCFVAPPPPPKARGFGWSVRAGLRGRCLGGALQVFVGAVLFRRGFAQNCSGRASWVLLAGLRRIIREGLCRT